MLITIVTLSLTLSRFLSLFVLVSLKQRNFSQEIEFFFLLLYSLHFCTRNFFSKFVKFNAYWCVLCQMNWLRGWAISQRKLYSFINFKKFSVRRNFFLTVRNYTSLHIDTHQNTSSYTTSCTLWWVKYEIPFLILISVSRGSKIDCVFTVSSLKKFWTICKACAKKLEN